MQQKTALIVDDSKTAQIRLKKQLDPYAIAVDVAFSAEEALAALPAQTPDVIFMDHNMGGMDGFEALRIIKNNPATAMIPVIMYTSEQGDVYVSQARALGAIDTLSKGSFEESNLEKLMHLLHIDRREEINASNDDLFDALGAANESKQEMTAAADASLREQEIEPEPIDEIEPDSPTYNIDPTHIADIDLETIGNQDSETDKARQELLLNDIECQLALQTTELKKLRDKVEESSNTIDQPRTEIFDADPPPQTAQLSTMSKLAILGIFIGIALVALFQFSSSKQIQRLNSQLNAVASQPLKEIDTNENVTAQSTQEREIVLAESVEPTASTLKSESLIETLNWAMSANRQYPFNEPPLDEKQILNIQNLVFRLSASGFVGDIELFVHTGNYCVALEPNTGNWILASNQMPFEECTFWESVATEEPADSYASIPFLQFLQTSSPITSGDIRVSLKVAGFSRPSAEYPSLNNFIEVRDWNAIANRNNRITFRLNPDNL